MSLGCWSWYGRRCRRWLAWASSEPLSRDDLQTVGSRACGQPQPRPPAVFAESRPGGPDQHCTRAAAISKAQEEERAAAAGTSPSVITVAITAPRSVSSTPCCRMLCLQMEHFSFASNVCCCRGLPVDQPRRHFSLLRRSAQLPPPRSARRSRTASGPQSRAVRDDCSRRTDTLVWARVGSCGGCISGGGASGPGSGAEGCGNQPGGWVMRMRRSPQPNSCSHFDC